MNLKLRTSVVLFLQVISVGSIWAQIDNERLTERIDSICSNYFHNEAPGAAVAIAKNGKLIFSKGYGLANMAHGIPIQTNTKFHITSCGKQFTAYAILKLEQEGKLSLKDEVHKYLPELHDFGLPITIDHLLTHTSGLRQETQLEHVVGNWSGEVMTQKRALQLIFNQKELNFAPGSQFTYSNSGYTLLSEIIERITEQSFDNWMQEHVFQPLGMENTLISDSYYDIIPKVAEAYGKGSKKYYRATGGLWQFYGGTGVYTNIEDTMRWLNYLNHPAQEDVAIISKMEEITTLNNGESITWGRGLMIQDDKIWHSGDSPGYKTWMGRYKNLGLDIALLSNYENVDPEMTVAEIVDLFLENKTHDISLHSLKTGEAIDKTSIVGWYRTRPLPIWYFSDLWKIESIDSKLYLMAGGNKMLLIPRENNLFEVERTPLTVAFHKNETDDTYTLTIYGPDGNDVADMISRDNYKLPLSEVTELTGNYYSPEIDTKYEIYREGDKIMVHHNSPFANRQWNDFQLQSVSEDFFISDKYFFTYVNFIRNAEGKIIGLRLGLKSDRVKNLWFEKE